MKLHEMSPVWALLLLFFFIQVNSNDIITTIAGTGSAGYGGDRSAATSATFNRPLQLEVDSAGIIYPFAYAPTKYFH